MEGAGEMWVFDFQIGVVGVEELVLEIIVKFRSMKFRRSSVFYFSIQNFGVRGLAFSSCTGKVGSGLQR